VGSTIHRVLLTKVPPQPGSTRALDAQQFLEESGVPVFKRWIRQYMAYADAFIEGVPVSRYKNPKSAEAWADYQAVMDEVLNGQIL
jgi:chromosome partitioning protein